MMPRGRRNQKGEPEVQRHLPFGLIEPWWGVGICEDGGLTMEDGKGGNIEQPTSNVQRRMAKKSEGRWEKDGIQDSGARDEDGGLKMAGAGTSNNENSTLNAQHPRPEPETESAGCRDNQKNAGRTGGGGSGRRKKPGHYSGLFQQHFKNFWSGSQRPTTKD